MDVGAREDGGDAVAELVESLPAPLERDERLGRGLGRGPRGGVVERRGRGRVLRRAHRVRRGRGGGAGARARVRREEAEEPRRAPRGGASPVGGGPGERTAGRERRAARERERERARARARAGGREERGREGSMHAPDAGRAHETRPERAERASWFEAPPACQASVNKRRDVARSWPSPQPSRVSSPAGGRERDARVETRPRNDDRRAAARVALPRRASRAPHATALPVARRPPDATSIAVSRPPRSAHRAHRVSELPRPNADPSSKKHPRLLRRFSST